MSGVFSGHSGDDTFCQAVGPTKKDQRWGGSDRQRADADYVGALPVSVRRELSRRYSLPEAWMDDFQYAEKHLWAEGRYFVLLRIFDPSLIGEELTTIRGYNDLDRWPSSVLFAGFGLHSAGGELDLTISRLLKRNSRRLTAGITVPASTAA